MADYEPDYTEYSLRELREARASIDESAYPDRTERLDLLIRDREAAAKREPVRVSVANDDGDIASVKPGRGVSFGRGISEIVISPLFAWMWINAVSDSPLGLPGVLIGWCVGVFGVIGGLYHLYNAFSEQRFSEQDIVAPEKEPDPFAVLIGREDRKNTDE